MKVDSSEMEIVGTKKKTMKMEEKMGNPNRNNSFVWYTSQWLLFLMIIG